MLNEKGMDKKLTPLKDTLPWPMATLVLSKAALELTSLNMLLFQYSSCKPAPALSKAYFKMTAAARLPSCNFAEVEYEPAGQGLHSEALLAPTYGRDVPAGQEVHSYIASNMLYFPVGQSSQLRRVVL
jgi:hypothetical protein